METPLVYGHRGASADAPENTLAAFELAGRLGAHGVELDVRRSADGETAVHHDAALADGRVIAETLRADLPDSVPTLEEALDACSGMVVNIEIKNLPVDVDFDPDCAVADQVVDILRSRGDRDRVLISSFHVPTVDRVKALAPDLPTGVLTFLAPSALEGISFAVERGHDAVHPHSNFVDEALVAAAHDAGLALNVWTVDDPARIRELAALGVDGIVTNVVGLALEVLAAS